MVDDTSSPPQTLPQAAPEAPPQEAAPVQEQTAAPSQPEQPSDGVKVYDISGTKAIEGTISHDQVTEAIASGKFSFPKGEVKVISPDGQFGTIDATEAPQAFQSGYRYALPDDVLQEEHGHGIEQVKAGLEGAARGVAGPLATVAEKALGAKDEDILAREKANPWTSGIGEGVGLGASLLTGVGEAAIAAKLGNRAVAHLAPEAVGFFAKLGAGAATAAIENGFIQGSNEVSKMILNDPEQSAQTAAANIGLAGLIGGGAGAAINAISPIWKATVGPKAAQLIEDVKGRLKYHIENPDPTTAVHSEIEAFYKNGVSHADEVYGAHGLKTQDIIKSVPEMHEGITEQVGKTVSTMEDAIKDLSSGGYQDPNGRFLQKELAKFKSSIAVDNSPANIFEATQKLKQQTAEWAKFEGRSTSVGDKDFIQASKKVANELKDSLEDTAVWGKAGERQAAINEAFRGYLKPLQDFESKFTTKTADGRVVDEGKVQTYMNQLGKKNAVLKQSMLKNFLDSTEKYLDVIDQTHANLGLDPIERTSTALARGTLDEITPGAKLADYIVQKGAAQAGGATLGAGVGEVAGHAAGMGGIGAMIGAHALGPFFSTALPNMLKGIMEKAGNSAALKGGAEYVAHVVKGENAIGQAAKAIFKGGREVLPQAVTQKERDSLDKKLSALKLDPTPLTKVGGDAPHYLEKQGQAMGTTTANAVNYLNSIKPNNSPTTPLGKALPVDPFAQAKYERALNIAQQPITVLDRLHKGTLVPSDVVALKAMYPALYTKFSNQLTTEMTNHMAAGETIPYKTRLGLSMFMAQPLDGTMTPTAIQSAQPQPQGQPPEQGALKPSQSGANAISKLPQTYQTHTQQREAARQKQ